MIETEQKLIQIGTSEGITLSKKDLAKLGAKRGDILKVKIELVNKQDEHKDVVDKYIKFSSIYGQTLKNLSDR